MKKALSALLLITFLSPLCGMGTTTAYANSGHEEKHDSQHDSSWHKNHEKEWQNHDKEWKSHDKEWKEHNGDKKWQEKHAHEWKDWYKWHHDNGDEGFNSFLSGLLTGIILGRL